MSLSMIAALLGRHRAATLAVLLLAVGAACDVWAAPVTYTASATVLFTPPGGVLTTRAAIRVGPSLIATEMTMAWAMTGQAAAAAARARGGTASCQVTPVNLYNMQYPDYAGPLATLTASSAVPATARRTFWVVYGLLAQRLASVQARAGVRPRDRIRVRLIGDPDPVARPGSRPRVFGGLAVLTAMGTLLVVTFLDRRRDARAGVAS